MKGEEVAEENVMDERNSSVKAICVAPTRDCNTDSGRVASSDGVRWKLERSIQAERLACFFGGLPVADDGRAMKRRPACVIGTPGRMKTARRDGHFENRSSKNSSFRRSGSSC